MIRIELFEHRLMAFFPMWLRAMSAESGFCQALVASGLLTEQQMLRAAKRYRLGCSRQGGVIYWQIDNEERIHDGKVMYYRADCHRDKAHKPTWVSYLLQRRYGWPDRPRASHCLFGLHLLGHTDLTDRTESAGRRRVCVVEAEKTAVILSEWRPECIWMATGGMTEVQPEKFRPLRGCRVELYPDTDPKGETYRRWCEAAQAVQQQLWWEGCQPIAVSSFLEQHASEEQKQRKIDIVDYEGEVRTEN